MKTLRLLVCGLLLALIAACGGGGGGAAAPQAAAAGATAQLSVTVIDTLGAFVAGATVSTTAAQATTDAHGKATLAVATGGEQTVRVDKSGFAEQVKVVNLAANAPSGDLVAMIVARDNAVAIAAIEGGGSATGRQGVKVTFPANALIDAAGRPVTGTIDMRMTPLDVGDVDVGAFPGLFEGIPTGAARQAIASYGTSELVPEQGGGKLQLAAGKTAQIELPIYVGKHQDGSVVAAGDTIPLWSLDASTGLWMQEGSGTVVASATSPTGFVLRATIAHFSWWNVDAVRNNNATVDLTVTVNNAVPAIPAGTTAPVDGRVVSGNGPTSTVTTTATLDVVQSLLVPAADAVTRLHTRFESGNQVCSGQVDVSPAPGATVSATLVASCITVPTPVVVRPAAVSSTNSAHDVIIDIDVNGSAPDSVEVLVDGTPIPVLVNGQPAQAFPAQFFYRAFWNSSTFPEGDHFITARATLAGNSRTSRAVDVVIDRTRPQTIAVAPTPGSDVDATTVYTVDFDEPVNALPFGLANVVRLTVTPLGQNVPQDVPATAALDPAGLRLTVTPQGQALPLGTVGLSWGGLQDAAGNAVTGTVAATFPVVRHATVGNDVPSGPNFIAMALDAAGVPHLVHTDPVDGHLELMKLGANGYAALGPAINDRPVGNFALAIRGAQILVAFEQKDASGNAAEVLVKRFDAATSTWQTLGGRSFAVSRPVTINSIRPQVAIDQNGQVVLAFIGSAGNLFGLEGWRFDGTNWTAIGSFSNLIFAVVLRLDDAGTPFVAYIEGSFGSNAARIGVLRNTGAAWVAVGGLLDSTFDATQGLSEPKLAIDAAGRPWVAWQHFADRARTSHVVQFDGSAFVEAPALPQVDSLDAFTLVGADALVVGNDGFGRINVLRLHAGVWEDPVFVDPPGGVANAVIVPDGRNALLGVTSGSIIRTTRVLFP